jgi:glucokinase
MPAHEYLPADVTEWGLAAVPMPEHAACVEALDIFCQLLGSCAGNLVLTLGAEGGVYIGGGVVPRLGDFFLRSGFREQFEAKGRMQSYLEKVPSFVIQSPYPALVGAAQLI